MKAHLPHILLGLLVGAHLAHADPKQVAEEHFKKANIAFDLGKWDEAIDGFSKAYEAWARPEFLFNIAQSHRLAGHCKEAALFYRKYLTLNKKVPAKQRASIQKQLAELDKCVADMPKLPDPPPPEPTPPPEPPPPDPKPPEPAVPTRPVVATARPDPEAPAIIQRAAVRRRGPRLSVEGSAGVGVLTAGDVQIDPQPTFALAIAYPVTSGRLRIELGVRASYMPLPYDTMTPGGFGGRDRAEMFGGYGAVAVAVPVTGRIVIRGDLGLGVMAVNGLGIGNPITASREAASYLLPSTRAGIGADVALSRNLSLTISPFALALGRGVDGMSVDTLREIEAVVGLGFRL